MIPTDLIKKYKYSYIHSCEILNEPFVKDLIKENQKIKRNCNIGYENLNFYREENQTLKKQLEEKENIACNWKDSCLENAGKIEKLENQQKEFIDWLEDKIKFSTKPTTRVLLKSILRNYKEIIGEK